MSAEPSCGYMHRGYEKLAEVRTYPQVTTLVNRIDWLGSFANEVPFILAAEKLMEVEAPPRAQWIRTMLFELSRLANIVLFLGDLGVQIGAVTPVFLAFRDREHVLNLIESVTGGRFHPNFDRIGGLKDDLPKGFVDECRTVMRKIRTFCDENEDLLIGGEIFQERTRNVGVIPREVALQYGLSGANLRASGVDWDLRRDQVLPLAWDKVDWKVWTHVDGDSFARCWVRLQETRESSEDRRPVARRAAVGSIMAKVPRIIKVPEGEAWVSTENPLGEMGYYVVSRGELGPFRVKIRSASFNNISVAPWVLRGVYVPDIITILASLYFILGDIDREWSAEIPYWAQSLLRVLGGIVAVLLPAGTIVYLFLFKMMSFMQSRLGPMEAGPYGSMQLVRRGRQVAAERGHQPEKADTRIFKMAPLIVCCRTFLLVTVVPFGPDVWFTNFDVGVFYILAVSSIRTLGILVAGWSSANKYSLLGGLRAPAS